MAVNLRASVRSVIKELKKNIAQKASELASLKDELKASELASLKDELNDALMESYPVSQLGQFSLGLEPLWAWVWSV